MHPRLLLLGTGIHVPVVSRVQAQKGQSGFKLQLHAHASLEFWTYATNSTEPQVTAMVLEIVRS